MENSSEDNETIERLANEVTESVRRGESPFKDDLQERYPELSGEIDDWVNTLSVLEEASFRRRLMTPSDSVVNASGRLQKSLGGFKLIREISRGGMGIVYEAEQESLNRRVAVKVLPPSPLLTDVERLRFEREGTAVARLHHSHIVPVFGTGVEQGVQYCVMQYIDGHSLDQLISGLRAHFGLATSDVQDADDPQFCNDSDAAEVSAKLLLHMDQPATQSGGLEVRTDPQASPVLPRSYWRTVARIGRDVADALGHAHRQGVLHRDIKPANLILDQSRHVWITDFGLAKLHDTENLTTSGSLIGTLRYTSPEQFQGQADQRSDIYALGLTLYELCVLEPAFSASDRRELMREVITETPLPPRVRNPRVPRDLETVLLKAMSQDPGNRYQDASDLSSDLDSFLKDRPVKARRQTLLELGWRWCRRHRRETALGGFALMMLLLFSTTASIAYLREARLRRESEATSARAREALDRLYNSYLPDWSTSSTVSAHGSIGVSPSSARLFEELVQIYDEMARSNTPFDEKATVLESAAAMRRVGLIYHRLGEFPESRRAYSRAQQILSLYYRDHPDIEITFENARTFNELSAVCWTERHMSEAFRYNKNALRLLSMIPSDEAKESGLPIQFEIARALYLLGRRGRGLAGGVLKRSDAASPGPSYHDDWSIGRPTTINRAVAILEDLMDAHPETHEYSHLLALCYRDQSDGILDDDGEPLDEQIIKAIQFLEYLVGAAPDHLEYQYALCTTLQWVRVDEDASPQAVEAATNRHHRAIEIAKNLDMLRPDEWIYTASLVQGHLQLSAVLKKGGRLDAALENCDSALLASKKLALRYPSCDTFEYWIAVTHLRKANVLRQMNRNAIALKSYNLAINGLSGLIEKRTDSEWKRVVTRNLYRGWIGKSKMQATLGRPKEAEASAARANKLVEPTTTRSTRATLPTQDRVGL